MSWAAYHGGGSGDSTRGGGQPAAAVGCQRSNSCFEEFDRGKERGTVCHMIRREGGRGERTKGREGWIPRNDLLPCYITVTLRCKLGKRQKSPSAGSGLALGGPEYDARAERYLWVGRDQMALPVPVWNRSHCGLLGSRDRRFSIVFTPDRETSHARPESVLLALVRPRGALV